MSGDMAARIAAVLGNHKPAVNSDGSGSCWCGQIVGWPSGQAAKAHHAHVAAALVEAGIGDVARAKAEALREAATWVIGCEHVTALQWCGICDQWRTALEDRAAREDGTHE